MSEPQAAGATAEQLVARIEKTMQNRRAGTETMRLAWDDGTLSKRDLPCHDQCNGQIVVNLGGEQIKGFCPVYMEPGICPLVALAERELHARLTRAGFGLRYHNPNPELIRSLEAVNEYLAHLRPNLSKGRGLILSGNVGVGKSMTLAYIARQLIGENVGVWMIHMPELIESLADRERRRQVVERAIKVEVLMIDDLGSGDMPDWVVGILDGIVEHRYANLRPVMIATNLSSAKLLRVPEFRRMVDRWREVCTWVGVAGTSQRHGSEKDSAA